MRLCFGTFASILNCCRQENIITQASFISKLVGIVDSKSRYRGYDHSLSGDGPSIKKLLSCEINFVLSGGKDTKIPCQDTIIKNFQANIVPYIDEDKNAGIIISLLSIIQNDDSIDLEKRETFKKYFGFDKQQLLHQSKFIFSDFLSRILLYTICGKIDNRIGKEYVKLINKNYISDIIHLYNYEYQWNQSTQTLTLSFVEMFNIFSIALRDYSIKYFITEFTPLISADLLWTRTHNRELMTQCRNFCEFINANIIIPFGPDPKPGITYTKIHQFTEALVRYASDLSMSYSLECITPRGDIFNVFSFEKQENSIKYNLMQMEKSHKELITIYQELCDHMFFSVGPLF